MFRKLKLARYCNITATSMKVPLPANLDIDAQFNIYPPIAYPKLKKDRLAFLLSLLISIPASNERIRKTMLGWVPFYSPLLQKRVKNYRVYLDYALGIDYPDSPAASLIKSDGGYIVGKRSKLYRFKEEFTQSNDIQLYEITDNTLINQFLRELQENRYVVNSLYPELVRWFNPEHLKIDVDNASKYIELFRNKVRDANFQSWSKIMNSTSDKSSLEYKDWVYSDENLQYQSSLHNIHRINEGNYFLSVDANVKRFHSNLSNIKSELRNFLTYQDQHLVSIDLKNAQPFLSLALLNPAFLIDPDQSLPDVDIDFNETINLIHNTSTQTDDEFTSTADFSVSESEADFMLSETATGIQRRPVTPFHISTVAPEIYEQLRETQVKLPLLRPQAEKEKRGRFLQLNLLGSLVMLTNSWITHKPADIEEYTSSVASGMFYEDFQQKIASTLNIEYSGRDKAKVAVFMVLFTSNSYFNSAEAAPKRKFAEVFPTIYKHFALFKKEDKSTLPRLLQSIESWLILDVVCSRITREKPELPIFTIHDSILTTSGNEEYVQKVMEEEIERHIGHKPTLATSSYHPDKLREEMQESS